MKTNVQTQTTMHKQITETTFEVCLGLLTTLSVLLQIDPTTTLHIAHIDLTSITNSIACASGSFAYNRLFGKEQKIEMKEILINSVVGYTIGVYSAGAWCEWKGILMNTWTAKVLFLGFGFVSMLVAVYVFEVGAGIRSGARKTGESIGKKIRNKLGKNEE